MEWLGKKQPPDMTPVDSRPGTRPARGNYTVHAPKRLPREYCISNCITEPDEPQLILRYLWKSGLSPFNGPCSPVYDHIQLSSRGRRTPSTIATVRRPLQQYLERQQNVSQGPRPRFLLAELLLHGRLPNFVLHDPARRNGTASYVSPHVCVDHENTEARLTGAGSRPGRPAT